jgi:hypothetical protein
MAAAGLSDAEHSAQLRRAVVASTVGTVIEAYDFLLYGQVAGLVFCEIVFPGIRSAGRHVAGFRHLRGRLCRPPGGGGTLRPLRRPHRPQGDLERNLAADRPLDLCRGLCAGLCRDRHLGAVILTLLRLIQGIGVGGEWSGAVLLSMEWAQTTAHRGFIASSPQWVGPAGLFLANLAVLAFSGR